MLLEKLFKKLPDKSEERNMLTWGKTGFFGDPVSLLFLEIVANIFFLFQYNFAIVTNGRPNYISEGATINIFDFRPSSNASNYQLFITLNLRKLA